MKTEKEPSTFESFSRTNMVQNAQRRGYKAVVDQVYSKWQIPYLLLMSDTK
jgi:hypothetical protein